MYAVYDQTFSESGSGDRGLRIDPVLARSWLLVNGAQYERFQPAADSRADIVVLDIEDAVAPKDKATARENVTRWLAAGNSDWVRVNGFGTQWWAADLEMLAGTSVGGVMLAMVESVDHVTETAKRLPNVLIVALVETARGLERIAEIASAKGTFRLAFGIGDFRRDTGFALLCLSLECQRRPDGNGRRRGRSRHLRRVESRQQEVSQISRELKALAKELNIPMVALSQLSRAPENRTDHRPQLADLRESGAIEQDADVVAFIYREEQYNKAEENRNIAELIVAKQRNGPTDTVYLAFLNQFAKFADLDRDALGTYLSRFDRSKGSSKGFAGN